MPNTNFQTIHQMGGAINSFVKQATGRDNVQNIDMEHITVAQNHYYEDVDISGRVVSFNAGAAGIPLEKCLVQIEPVQEGTGDPSPDNVRPISGWTGAKVTRTGKNLVEDTLNGYSIVSNGTFEQTSSFAMHIARVKAGQQYVITASDSYFVGGFFTEKPTPTSTTYNNSRTVELTSTFVAPIDGYVAFRTAASFSSAQLELGSTATAYEPYQGDTYDITFPSEAGTVYGGTLDVTTGKLVVTHGQIASYNGETLPGEWISDRDVYAEGTTPTIGAQVVYKLAEPQTYTLTPTEIRTLLGQNNIWADTGDIEVKFKNIKEFF